MTTTVRQWRYLSVDLGQLGRRERLEDLLNELGRDGWELVTVARPNLGLFKQEVINDDKAAHVQSAPQVKYRDPNTGETWSGRGRVARWLAEHLRQGRKAEEFLV